MWCKICNKIVNDKKCPDCGNRTQEDIPIKVYWCDTCSIPIIKEVNDKTIHQCPLCEDEIKYIGKDLRPVFPEERLLIEVLKDKPLKYKDASVWSSANRYYINGSRYRISTKEMKEANPNKIRNQILKYQEKNKNTYNGFYEIIKKFIKANKERLNKLKNEAHSFIQKSREGYKDIQVIVSFSGGKDSTVVSDLVMKALSNPKIVHIFGNTTLEFPLTIEYKDRFRKNNPKTILREAKNTDQEFYTVCDEIGPPSRVMRWCCTMFKTGPINRVISSIFREKSVLTFYGIRKFESTSRSKYDRIYDSPKILKQKVAAPIFNWRDIDLWLYMLAENLDFNDAYRLGYDRVGCWCCPNNSERSHFLNEIYMPDQTKKWRNYLIDFAKKIGKPDPEVYVDSGNWKARQGGYGVDAAKDVKIVYTNCTTEVNAKIYSLNRPLSDEFYNLFIPFGKVSKELGRKLIGEVLVLHPKTNIPIISIQPFKTDEYETSVKIQTLNVKDYDKVQRMISYQVRKYNACKKCLGCETVCIYRAIKVGNDGYKIDENKCKRCMKCVTAKHLEYGCLMGKYLFTASSSEEDNWSEI
ncbi:phosphoadenosine phosphosulfate reductase [Crassaminicella thermophila]|uniref:Phosphoadenosine phosphosulfate reductase n=1 Tax=Crassaminicella thermophila TaxID=2599308 RepID=A0A5C0SBR7_CRATE|nr:phosphoadenosine phosphosulfate reductase family protein [Crassaminicella thermophila]QEK11540.1 phosphoadenosine phosphosulfate reductase [Crassaminicella thermophila]